MIDFILKYIERWSGKITSWVWRKRGSIPQGTARKKV